jgi:transcriptional regulator with XRE-family HTH domain
MAVRSTNFGENVVARRQKLGITQKKLAEMIGIAKQSLSTIEHDIKKPNIKTATMIAIALDTSIDYLANTDGVRELLQEQAEKEKELEKE